MSQREIQHVLGRLKEHCVADVFVTLVNRK